VTVFEPVPDFLRDYPNEFETEFKSKLADLYAELKKRHSWIRRLFSAVCVNEADIDALVNETFSNYLQNVGAMLWVTQGVSVFTDTIADDGVAIAVALSGKPPEPISDIEKYTYAYPDAMFGTIARNLRVDYLRKLTAQRKRITSFGSVESTTRHEEDSQDRGAASFVEDLCECPRSNVEQSLIFRVRNLEIHRRYVVALKKVAPVQRAAWILCKDELLRPKEAERLLVPLLHWRPARAAVRTKPMDAGEAARVLGRGDVSPDVTKARARLAEQLADLNPCQAWDTPPQKFSREYLIGCQRCGSTRAMRPRAYSTKEHLVVANRDKDFIWRMPADT
jgi:DNA-directed RNA polymerase specialized sigma24 family protein